MMRPDPLCSEVPDHLLGCLSGEKTDMAPEQISLATESAEAAGLLPELPIVFPQQAVDCMAINPGSGLIKSNFIFRIAAISTG